jgi:hypothetical protein
MLTHFSESHIVRDTNVASEDIPLHKMQFAYQAGKPTVSALHHLVTKIEKALRFKEVALWVFVDIQGAFDNTGFESIRAAGEEASNS